MRVEMSREVKAHARRLKVAFTFLGCFATLLVFGAYNAGGVAPALSAVLSFAVLGLYAAWAFKRVAAWRASNPSAQMQHVPFSVLGGSRLSSFSSSSPLSLGSVSPWYFMCCASNPALQPTVSPSAPLPSQRCALFGAAELDR
jgi:hypothetical protein